MTVRPAYEAISKRFIAELIPSRPSPTELAPGLPFHTGANTVVNVIHWRGAEQIQELERCRRRKLPTVIVIDPGSRDTAWLPGAWLESDAVLSAPVIAVAVGQEVSLPLDWAQAGPDIVARQLGSMDQEIDADLTAQTPEELAALVDRALRVLTADPATTEPSSGRLSDLVPLDLETSYSMDSVVERLLDPGTILELRRPQAPELLTAIGRCGGTPVAVLASRPAVERGWVHSVSLPRIQRFLSLVGNLRLPLVTVVDSLGVEWGKDPGALETMRDVLLQLQSLEVLKCSLLAGRVYGTAAALFGAVSARADYIMAWPRAVVSRTMSDASGENGDGTSAFPAPERSVMTAARDALVIEVVHPDETRRVLLEIVNMTRSPGLEDPHD